MISDMDFLPEAVRTLAIRHRLQGNPILPNIKHRDNNTRTLTFATENGTDVTLEYESAFHNYRFNVAFNTLMDNAEADVVRLICTHIDYVSGPLASLSLQDVQFKEPFKTWMSDSLFAITCTDKLNLLSEPILKELNGRCEKGQGYIVVANSGSEDLVQTVTNTLDDIISRRTQL